MHKEMRRRYIVEDSVSSATTRVFHPRISKPKHAELTRSQLFGIGVSVLLSLVITATVLGLIYLLSPYILAIIRYIISFQYLKDYLKTTPIILSVSNLTVESFRTELFNQKPVLFSSPSVKSSDLLYSMELLQNEYKSKEFSLHNLSSLSDCFSREQMAVGPLARFFGNRRRGRVMSLERYSNQPNSAGSLHDYEDLILVDKDVPNQLPKLSKLWIAPAPLEAFVDGPTPSRKPSFVQRLKNIGSRLSRGLKGKVEANVVESRRPGKIHVFSDATNILSVVNIEKGPSFHQSEHSWHLLLSGELRWGLYRYDDLPRIGFDPAESYKQWYDKIYPTLWQSQLPIEIIQQPGEILYIPEGWYRGYYSVSNQSVLISQISTFCDRASAYCNYLEAVRREVAGDISSAITFLKNGLLQYSDSKMHMKLAMLQLKSSDVNEALENLKSAVTASYRNPQGYIELVHLYETNELADENVTTTEIKNILRLGHRLNISSNCEAFHNLVLKYEI